MLLKLQSREHANLHSIYKDLSKYFSSGYKVTWNLNSTFLQSSVAPKKSLFNAKYSTSLDETLPYIPCSLAAYPTLNVKSCIENINKHLKRSLRIAFVGDSVARLLLEDLVRDYKKVFDFHFADSRYNLTLEEHFLDHKIKDSIPIFGRGLQLRFYWAPFLERSTKQVKNQHPGAKEHLVRWAENTAKENDFPDLLILSSGMWSFSHYDYSEAFDNHLNMLNKLRSTLQKLARETKTLWLAMPPIKPWLEKKYLKSSSDFIIEIINTLTKHFLRHTEIWFWDSLNPIIYKEINECHSFLYMQSKHNVHIPEEWRCSNFCHGGRRAMSMGVKLLWNLLCNYFTKSNA